MKLAIVLLLTCAVAVIAINRGTVVSRARNWVDRGVPYSQSAWTSGPDGGRYRQDCSGFVSMAWKLGDSKTTRTLPQVSRRINKNDLRAGDILLNIQNHAVIFDKWTDGSRTRYWAYEQTPPKAVYHQVKYPYWNLGGYEPYRYNNIQD